MKSGTVYESCYFVQRTMIKPLIQVRNREDRGVLHDLPRAIEDE